MGQGLGYGPRVAPHLRRRRGVAAITGLVGPALPIAPVAAGITGHRKNRWCVLDCSGARRKRFLALLSQLLEDVRRQR